jgi:hypothetical protein
MSSGQPGNRWFLSSILGRQGSFITVLRFTLSLFPERKRLLAIFAVADMNF